MDHIREATSADVGAMSILEMDLVGIHRDKDFKFLIYNAHGFWHVSIYENGDGQIQGFMASSAHPACNMIGPGAAKTPQQAAALIAAELDRHRGRRPSVLIPIKCKALAEQMYHWGAKNREIQFAQVRGRAHSIDGLFMPTFLPESS